MVTFIHLLNTYMLSTEWAPSSVLGTGVTCCKQQEKEFLILRADGLQGGGMGRGERGADLKTSRCSSPNVQVCNSAVKDVGGVLGTE